MRSLNIPAALGLDPQKLLNTVGVFGLFAIVFAESGIMIGFFLPGDSLLFAAGLFAARGDLTWPIWAISLGCAIAAIAGDQVGYMFGKKVGPGLFKREDSRLFKAEYVAKSEIFFKKHGPKAIVLARFVPVVRTFTPIIAGVSHMHYRTFLKYNIIGGAVWAIGFTQLGFWLGKRFPWMVEKIEYVAIVIVVFSLVPIAVEVIRHRREAKRELAAAETPAPQ